MVCSRTCGADQSGPDQVDDKRGDIGGGPGPRVGHLTFGPLELPRTSRHRHHPGAGACVDLARDGDLARQAAPGEAHGPAATRSDGSSVEAIVGRFAAGREFKTETTLEELGLGSLDRVELMMALEDAFQTTIDEASIDAARPAIPGRLDPSGRSTVQAIASSHQAIAGTSLIGCTI